MKRGLLNKIRSFFVGCGNGVAKTGETRFSGLSERVPGVYDETARLLVDDPTDVMGEVVEFCRHFGRQMIVTEILAHDAPKRDGDTRFYVLDGRGLRLITWADGVSSGNPFLSITDSEGRLWSLTLLKTQKPEAERNPYGEGMGSSYPEVMHPTFVSHLTNLENQ